MTACILDFCHPSTLRSMKWSGRPFRNTPTLQHRDFTAISAGKSLRLRKCDCQSLAICDCDCVGHFGSLHANFELPRPTTQHRPSRIKAGQRLHRRLRQQQQQHLIRVALLETVEFQMSYKNAQKIARKSPYFFSWTFPSRFILVRPLWDLPDVFRISRFSSGILLICSFLFLGP